MPKMPIKLNGQASNNPGAAGIWGNAVCPCGAKNYFKITDIPPGSEVSDVGWLTQDAFRYGASVSCFKCGAVHSIPPRPLVDI